MLIQFSTPKTTGRTGAIKGLIDRLRRWMEIEMINKHVNFPAVSYIEIILLGENLITGAIVIPTRG